MIQRIQSLFLVAIVALSALSLVVPFQVWTLNDRELLLTLMPGPAAPEVNSMIYPLVIVNILVLFFALTTIFRYKKRPTQFKLANLLILMNALLTGIMFVASFTKEGVVLKSSHFGIAAFFPVVNIFLAFLAARFIKKDEALVRNADRIR